MTPSAPNFQVRDLALPDRPRHGYIAQGSRGIVSFRGQGHPPPSAAGGRRTAPVNLPRTVGLLIAVNIAVYLLQITMPPVWERWVIFHLGFIPARWSLPGGLEWSAFAGPFSHQFLHGGTAHLFVNVIMLAAFGSGVERLLGGQRLMLMYLLSGGAGAAMHWVFYPEGVTPVVGASGAISGLFGAILRLMAKNPRVNGGFLRILPVVVIWLGIAVLTGFTGMPGAGEAQVAWAAHVGGFLFTLLLFDFFTFGAWPRRVD